MARWTMVVVAAIVGWLGLFHLGQADPFEVIAVRSDRPIGVPWVQVHESLRNGDFESVLEGFVGVRAREQRLRELAKICAQRGGGEQFLEFLAAEHPQEFEFFNDEAHLELQRQKSIRELKSINPNTASGTSSLLEVFLDSAKSPEDRAVAVALLCSAHRGRAALTLDVLESTAEEPTGLLVQIWSSSLLEEYDRGEDVSLDLLSSYVLEQRYAWQAVIGAAWRRPALRASGAVWLQSLADDAPVDVHPHIERFLSLLNSAASSTTRTKAGR